MKRREGRIRDRLGASIRRDTDPFAPCVKPWNTAGWRFWMPTIGMTKIAGIVTDTPKDIAMMFSHAAISMPFLGPTFKNKAFTLTALIVVLVLSTVMSLEVKTERLLRRRLNPKRTGSAMSIDYSRWRFDMNTVKIGLLMAMLTLMLVFIGGLIGGKSGLTIAVLMSFGLNFITFWFSDRVVLKMYGAREVGEMELPEIYLMVRRLSFQAGLPMPKVYVIEKDQPNAFATGRNPEHGAVAITTGIMRMLSREELEGVIGHELAHIKHRDILVGTVAAAMAGAISYLAQMAQWAAIFGYRGDNEEGGNPIASLVMMIVGPIAAMMVQMAISRSREYEADKRAAEIAGNPLHLARALTKLHLASQCIRLEANPATSHMFIVNPLSEGGLIKLFSTHPPIEQRIARLEAIRFGA